MNNVCGARRSRKVIIPHCSADSVVQYHTTEASNHAALRISVVMGPW